MARRINIFGADGDISDRYELRGGMATGHTSARERISLFHHDASVSPPPAWLLAPGLLHEQQLRTQTATEDTIMKCHKLIITFLSAAAFTVGCNKEGTTSQQLDQVQAKTEAAAQDMKDYTYAQKAQFVEKMQGQLTELHRDVDQLAARIEKSSDTFKAEAKPKLQALRDQTAQLNKQLDEVRNATESTWDSVKNGFKQAYESSKDGFNQARQWVSDKIAP